MKIRAPKPKALRAIHANAGLEAWYRRCLLQALRCMHESILYHLAAAWKRCPPEIGFAHDAGVHWDQGLPGDGQDHKINTNEPMRPGRWVLAEDAPSSSIMLQRALSKWGKLWTRKLNDLSFTIAAKFAQDSFKQTDSAMRSAFRDAGFTVRFKTSARVAQAFQAVVAENVNLIKSIPQQYLKDVQTQVWQSVMAGSDMDALSKNLAKTYAISRHRAAFIARDQNNKAKAVIENARRKEMGLTQAIWQHSGGGKEPRPTHIGEMNGKVYELAEGMWDSDERKYVWPGELINCRCTSRAIIPGFD